MRRLPDATTSTSARDDAAGHQRDAHASFGGRPGAHGRIFVWHTGRGGLFPGGLALILLAPILLALGAVTVGLVVATLAGAVAAPRLLRRRDENDELRVADNDAPSAITLERGEYRRVD